MEAKINAVAGLADKVGNAIDRNTESGEERQQQLSARHKEDMLSDSWLSKNVRPLAFLASLFMVFLALVATAILKFHGKEGIDAWVYGELVLLAGTFGGFYFNSRRTEKVAARNADANIKMERMKLKAEIVKDKRELRRQIKAEKRANRDQD